ncbi:vegetative cell wall protein gp1-like [Schistocerca americana]|uniref:vegetative cell wall protein gp1-like n=1 Tax=Schistocerca americana TaxID=7009 RepID=UPI001F501C0C|nr:vegetative cell wall protein gp1-like [Schistocerca americana]
MEPQQQQAQSQLQQQNLSVQQQTAPPPFSSRPDALPSTRGRRAGPPDPVQQQQPSSPQRLLAPPAPPPARPAAPSTIVDDAPVPLAPPPPVSQPSQRHPRSPFSGKHPADVDEPMPVAPSRPAPRIFRNAAPHVWPTAPRPTLLGGHREIASHGFLHRVSIGSSSLYRPGQSKEDQSSSTDNGNRCSSLREGITEVAVLHRRSKYQSTERNHSSG